MGKTALKVIKNHSCKWTKLLKCLKIQWSRKWACYLETELISDIVWLKCVTRSNWWQFIVNDVKTNGDLFHIDTKKINFRMNLLLLKKTFSATKNILSLKAIRHLEILVEFKWSRPLFTSLIKRIEFLSIHILKVHSQFFMPKRISAWKFIYIRISWT